jgi:hypothetical protein
MVSRRIVVIIGAVALVAVTVALVRWDTLAPVAPVGDVARASEPMPADRDQDLLTMVGVRAGDLGPGYTAHLIDQGDQLSQPTLDLCSRHFASEARRQARHQVAVSDSTGDPLMSTEAVLYRDQAGAAEAMAEIRGAASRCPKQWQVHGQSGLGPMTAGMDRVGLSVTATLAGQPMDPAVLVFLRRGRLLLGLYFLEADGPQAQIDGTDSIPGTVAVFQQRVAAVPAADLG